MQKIEAFFENFLWFFLIISLVSEKIMTLIFSVFLIIYCSVKMTTFHI